MKAGVVVFPGSNCDRDAIAACRRFYGATQVTPLWHKETSLPALDLIILPGGFSYGDYLRCGAMAAHSPIMREVVKHADAGRYVLGICNGFQILTESRLLPGALMRNASLNFICREVTLRVENNQLAFTRHYAPQQVIRVPVAHHDGCYTADAKTLAELEANGQIAFRYCTADGEITSQANPNGASANIAGITNARGNVLGMMPHPERVVDALTGGTDGAGVFMSLAA